MNGPSDPWAAAKLGIITAVAGYSILVLVQLLAGSYS